MQKSEIIKVLAGKGTNEEKADRLHEAFEGSMKAERDKNEQRGQSGDPGQVVKKVEVNTGDDGSNVVSHASSYGLHIGVDQHGRAREVSFDRGAKIVTADANSEERDAQKTTGTGRQ